MRLLPLTTAARGAGGDLSRRAGFRADIQALRAVAVAAVVLWHIDPRALPGGFVGVDVFFVISGYLMTRALTRSDRLGWREMADFWARRCRRILPAATVVILITLAAAWFLLPATRRVAVASDSLWAGAYLINWRLADASVDYLESLEPPSHLQHFWSLAVEEQFYLLWPLVIGAALLLAARRPIARVAALWWAVGFVVATSFVWSTLSSAASPDAAYFTTTTRIWELALGGVVALLPRLRGRWAIGGAAVGAAGVLTALAALPSSAAFPGWIAAWPTCATALVIWADLGGGRGAAARAAEWWPVQRLGDVSYSLYLWHWPVIVFLNPYDRPPEIWSWQSLVAVVVSLVLAWLTWRFVEQPFRSRDPRRWWSSVQGGLRLGIASLALLALLALPARALAPAMAQPPQYPGPPDRALGAEALAAGEDPSEPLPGDGFMPDPARLSDDLPFMYEAGCHLGVAETVPVPCVTGDTDGDAPTVALVGDSHAAQWAPALEAIAEQQGWRVVVHTKSSCPFTRAPVALWGTDSPYPQCDAWNDAVMEQLLAEPPALVLTSNAEVQVQEDGASRAGQAAEELVGRGLAQAWGRLLDAGIGVAVILDTPAPGYAIETCIANEPADLSTCSFDRQTALASSGTGQAVGLAIEPRAASLDLAPVLCSATTCPALIGGVLVYRDRGHLSATFAATLSDRLLEALQPTGLVPLR